LSNFKFIFVWENAPIKIKNWCLKSGKKMFAEQMDQIEQRTLDTNAGKQ